MKMQAQKVTLRRDEQDLGSPRSEYRDGDPPTQSSSKVRA